MRDLRSQPHTYPSPEIPRRRTGQAARRDGGRGRGGVALLLQIRPSAIRYPGPRASPVPKCLLHSRPAWCAHTCARTPANPWPILKHAQLPKNLAGTASHAIMRTLWRGSIVWPNARAWKVREPKGSKGSNPFLSASTQGGSHLRAPFVMLWAAFTGPFYSTARVRPPSTASVTPVT